MNIIQFFPKRIRKFLGLDDTFAAYVAGRVLFEAAAGVDHDDNLFWDNVNKRLGIGTVTPSKKLEVKGIIKNSDTRGIITTWRSTRSDPTANKWYKIGSLTLAGQYQVYHGTFITNTRGITTEIDSSTIYKLSARQPAMASSPVIDLQHYNSVSNIGYSFKVKAIIVTDTVDLKEIELYVGGLDAGYLYYSHAILNQNVDVGGSFAIIEGDTGVLLADLPAGTQINMVRGIITLSNGYVGLGTSFPKTKLHVTGLPIYANNAAAVTGGLTAGAFYRTGADPDPVCVVH